MPSTPIGVDRTDLLIDKLGEESGPLQFLREFTHNALQAAVPGRPITCIWSATKVGAAPKLTVTDNGTGMTRENLASLIGNLASSGQHQDLSSNFGIGAKVSALPFNRCGVIYRSWVDGAPCGHEATIKHDQTAGTYVITDPKALTLDERPAIIAAAGSGTQVVFLGNESTADTTVPPTGRHKRDRWIIRELNNRYYTLNLPGYREPTVKVAADLTDDTDVAITGQAAYLKRHVKQVDLRDATGFVELKPQVLARDGGDQVVAAEAEWWILDNVEDLRAEHASDRYPGHHVAAVFQNELYDVAYHGTAPTARLSRFGVTHGQRAVVVYVHIRDGVTAAANRNNLAGAASALPWEEWGADFAANMPDVLADHVAREKAQAITADNEEKRRELDEILKALNVGRFRPSRNGPTGFGGLPIPGGDPAANENSNNGTAAGGGEGGTTGDGDRPHGDEGRARRVSAPDYPQVEFYDDDLEAIPEDRAALYDEHTNTVKVNLSFRVIQQFRAHWRDQLKNKAKIEEMEGLLRQAIDLAVREHVATLKDLVSTSAGGWSISDRAHALSPETLTPVLLQRRHWQQLMVDTFGERSAAKSK